MGKLTIQDIAKVLVDRNDLSKKEASNFANEMFDIIQESLDRDKVVKVKGFGTFKIIDVDPRESVNVNTGERVLIEGHNKITFTPDQLLKEIVNKPFSQFETVVLNEGVDFAEEIADGAYLIPEISNDQKEESGEEELVKSEEREQEEEAVDKNDIAATMPLVEFVEEDKSLDNPVGLEEPEVEEMPAPEEKPAVEEMPAPEEKPAVEETAPVNEPISEEPAPVEEPMPVAKEELMPVAQSEEEDIPGEEETETADSETDTTPEETADEEESSGGKRWLMPAVTLLLGLGIGYLLGNYFPMKGDRAPETPEPPVEVPKLVVEDTLTVDSAVATPATPDTIQKPVVEKVEAAKPEEVRPEASKAPETKPAEPHPTTSAAVESDKYAAMDARVRTGAYRIIGTDRVMKVKEGDDLHKITQRTLGPEMECYVEVYNGLKASSELKVGQEIKIPKLQLKKKKKAQNAN